MYPTDVDNEDIFGGPGDENLVTRTEATAGFCFMPVQCYPMNPIPL